MLEKKRPVRVGRYTRFQNEEDVFHHGVVIWIFLPWRGTRTAPGALFCWVYGRGRLQNPRRSAEQLSRWGEEERRTEGVPPSTASKGLEIIGRYGDCGLVSARGEQGDGIADETEKAPDSQKESGAFG